MGFIIFFNLGDVGSLTSNQGLLLVLCSCITPARLGWGSICGFRNQSESAKYEARVLTHCTISPVYSKVFEER